METVRAGGFEIAFERRGAGPPLLLLHGVLQDSRAWRLQLESLADSFTVIAWEAPGSGNSSDPPESFTLADYADSLAAFIDALALDSPHVVGLSWGGILALEFYRRHAKLLRSLVLADTYAGWRGSLPEEVISQRLETSIRESEMAPEDFIPGWIPGLLSEHASKTLVDETIAMMSDFHPVGYRTVIRSSAQDLREVLPTIAVTTLLIWGELDARSPVSVGETFRDTIPGAKLVLIPKAGHLSNLEQPERFNDAVRDFCLSI